jgi:hypothetical protein
MGLFPVQGVLPTPYDVNILQINSEVETGQKAFSDKGGRRIHVEIKIINS